MLVFDLRYIQHDDAAFIARWHSHYFPNGWSTESVQQTIKSPSVIGVIAMEGAAPIGALIFQDTGDEAEILTLFVLPTVSGRGVATMLLQHLVYLKKGAIIHLEVSSQNLSAQHVYKKVGFRVVGLRPNYYGQGVDGIMMTLSLFDKNNLT